MAMNVPPSIRSRADQEFAEYTGHIVELVNYAGLTESTGPAVVTEPDEPDP